jgi:uncharacterized repeat protein (TIGR01451 family)/uncharacterized delta-60 repeat protein
MSIVQLSRTRRAGRSWAAIWAVAAFCGGSALESQAQPAPPNDNLTNAQVIQGISGSLQATNISATVETGEPGPAGVTAQSTIWYVWTAPITMNVDFNTRNSTDPAGLPLDTMLGVYTNTIGDPLGVATLGPVAGNVDDPSGGVTSRVDFQAIQGTAYYIQVGSTTNSGDGYGQGRPHLNWGTSLVAGGFGFSTSTFLMSSLENWLIDEEVDGDISPSLYGLGQGTANARITVTRTGGAVGRCQIDVTLSPVYYTNLYETNYLITNIFITNYSNVPLVASNEISFTNIFLTNIASINWFNNFEQGVFLYLPVDGDLQVSQTNTGTATTTNVGPIVTTVIDIAGLGLPDYFTNFPCPPPPYIFPPTSVSNNGVITVSATNIYCGVSNVLVPVPAAYEGIHYSPLAKTTYTFDDFQMSQDIFVQVDPAVPPGSLYPGNYTWGPLDPELASDPNYVYPGLNALVQVTLSNLVLDPLENPDIVPPTIVQPSANINILNLFGDPAITYSNSFLGLFGMINFERVADRCNKLTDGQEVYVYVWVQQFPNNGGSIAQHVVNYTVESLFEADPPPDVVDDNVFATVADADYAVPLETLAQPTADFGAPGNTDWAGTYGTLTFPANNPFAQPIFIPIFTNGAVEFDMDIYLQLFLTLQNAQQDATAMPPAFLGNLTTSHLTINFNNVAGNGVQPGGALDWSYNVDNQASSYPPHNTVPGANSVVNAVAIQANGEAVIGGDFDAFNTTPMNYIARLQANGLMANSLTGLGRGPNNFVNAIVIDASGRMIIGGNFTSVNATNAFFIARLNYDGSLDTNFATGFGFNGNVYALTIDGSGNILVGGNFTSFDKTNCNHIARLLPSGGMDPNFLPSSGIGVTNGTDQDVHAVAVDGLGNIILGGNFTRVNGTNWNHIARLLPNGSLDASFNPGFAADGNVMALAVQPNNAIILGGAFQHFNLISRNSIARLTASGALDTSFDPGSGFDDIVYSLVRQPDGNILAGGQFTTYNGVRRVGMARLLGSPTGQGGWLDTSFMDTGYNQFAGLINHYYNTNAYNTNDFATASNQRHQVLAMGLQPDGNIVIGGSFGRLGGGSTRVETHIRQNVARVIGPATPGPAPGLDFSAWRPYPNRGPANPVLGSIGNNPGNIGLTQNPYTADDTAGDVYITLDRQNGSLGAATVTLGTNTLPPSTSSATARDFGLLIPEALYDIIWDVWRVPGDVYGWRMGDGFYATNDVTQTLSDFGESALYLTINNDPSAAPILYANLNLLNLNANNLLVLGGVPMPLEPAFGQATSQLDIVNDNFPAGTIGFSATNYNVLESGGTVTLTLLRTNGTYGSPSVTVNAVNGTALNGTDYSWTSQQVQFANGATSTTFTMPIIDHNTQQSNKFFSVFLSSPTQGASVDTNIPPLVPSNSVVTIIDDHFQPGYLSFSSPAYSVLKAGTATISVIRTGAALGQLSVEVGTSNGTAINNLNYVGVTNTLSWTNRDISPKTITVQTLQDNTVEGNNTVNLFLFNAQVAGNSSTLTNAEVLASPSNAVLTIVDTDSYGNINFLTPYFNVFQNGGQALITIARTGGTVGTVSVNFSTYSPTNVQLPFLAAMAGSNFSATNGLLTFGPGVSSQSFTVPIVNTPGETNMADRIVGLQLFSGSPSNIAGQFPKTAILTILDPKLHLNSAGSVDTTTQNGIGFNNFVNSLSLQPDGSLLAGGEFTYFNSYPFSYVGRLLLSGYFDTGFQLNLTGPDGPVWQVLSQSASTGLTNGDIMIVGDFSQVNQANSPGMARLNLDGGLDASFNPGAGADGTVYTIAQMFLPSAATNLTNLPYYVIGGTFANFNGNPASGVARVTPSGLFDPSFNIGEGVTSSNAAVHALAITPANQILVGGDFTAFDNRPHHHLVRLNVDGTLDTNFTAFDGISSDINGSIRVLVVQPDGRILIGGLFTTINGSNFNYIARLNSDGTTDTNFTVGVGCNNNVQAIALDSQLRILAGGSFSTASGVTRNGLTRFNADGTVDPSINFGFGANGFVDAIAVQTNDEIDVGGGFSTFGNLPENNFARLYGGANAGNGSVQFSQQVYGVLENATNAVIDLQRLGGTFGSPSVTAVFFTSNNTAVSGRDYIGVTNTVSFPLGETFESVLVPIIDNSTIGPDLSVNLLLTNPPANSEPIGPQVNATLIITNVNTGLEFSAQGYRESAGSGSAAIEIVRVGNPNTQASVTAYTGTNGTAAPNVDYIPESSVIVFYPGVITNYFLIPILNSPTTFQDTTVDLELEDPSNAIVTAPSSATLTIGSALTGPGFLTLSSNSYSVSEGATNAVITVLRTNGNNNTVTVQLTTSDGTAIAGINYSNASTVLTFLAGQNIATDNIPIIQLTNAVPNTTVNITLSNPTGGAVLHSPTNAVLTIVDDIADYFFSSASYFVSEGAGSATLTVLRGGPTNATASVFYTTYSPTNASETNGLAVPNVDYIPTSGTLVFPPGVTLETVPVTILQGSNVNPVISFQVLLQNPSAGTQIGAPGTATVGIISDVTGFAFATNAYFVGENGSNIVITVNRLNPDTGSLAVHFITSDNTAVNGVDYVATNGTLNFLNGQATNSFIVQVLDPNLVESDKTFNITLFSPSAHSYVVAPSNTVVTITNVYVGLSFGSPSFTVSECAVSAAIPVILTGLTNSAISVQAYTADGSGKAGVNYFPTNVELEFLPGQTVAYFYVTPINNHVIGPDHTVVLNLNNNFPAPSTVGGVELLTPSTALLTIQECNGAFIVKSGTAFVTGSIEPSTGVIYSNDTVTVLLGLRDVAGGNTSNLVATLLATNGITNVSSPKSYGVLIENGPTVSRAFTFTAAGTNGQNIIATLTLQDGARDLGMVGFGFTVGGNTASYTNAATIFLPENFTAPTIATNSIPPGYGYPSLIDVSGIPGLMTRATVTLSNFGHSFPRDVDVVLEAPNGSNSILMSHCGASYNVAAATLTFDQTASTYVPDLTKLTSGTYLPSGYAPEMPRLPTVPVDVNVPVAAPVAPFPYGTNLSTFLGASPNGTWSLWAICDNTLDSGYISNGWSLNISTGVPVENDSDLEVTVNPVPAQATASNLLTYFVTVTNFGPSAATNVVITDYLPAGAVYLSNSCNCGTVTNGTLTVSLPSLAVGAGTAFNIAVMPTALGFITNAVTALALEPDPNSNNMITNINLVNQPSADLGLNLTGSPNLVLAGGDVTVSVEVTNGGPSEAIDVTATLLMPGFVPDTNGISASAGTATNVDGTITWTLGDLPFSLTGAGPTLTVAARALTAGTNLVSASVSSAVYDPLKGNNFSSVKIVVEQPLLSISGVTDSYLLTWSALATNYTLQGATALPPQGTWTAIPAPPIINGLYTFSLPGNNGYHFFRLSAQMH